MQKYNRERESEQTKRKSDKDVGPDHRNQENKIVGICNQKANENFIMKGYKYGTI